MTQAKSTAPTSLLLIAYAVFFSMGIMSSVLNVAWSYMHADMGVDFEALGVLLLASTGGGLIGSFFSGRLIGRLGLGRYLLIGSALVAVGLLGYSIVPTWEPLLLVAFVTALGTSSYNAGLNLFVAAHFSTGRLNWLHAAYGVGLAISPTLTTLLIQHWQQSWRLAYLISCAATVGVLALLLITRRRWTLSDSPDAPSETIEHASLWETLHLRTVLLGMAIFFLFNGILIGIGQLLTTLLTGRGVAEAEAGFWVSVYWGSFTTGRIIMGFVAHRLNNAVLVRVCLFGAAVGGVLLWQNASTGINLLGLALIGLSCAPLYPTLIAEAHRSVAPRYRAHSIGMQISSSAIGQALIPGVMAWLALHVSLNTVGIVAAFGMLGTLALYQAEVRRKTRVAVAV